MVTAAHVHRILYDDVRGPLSTGRCACGYTTEGRNWLIASEIDQLEGREGICQMPMKRKEQQPMSTPLALPPLPIELSTDALTMRSLNLKLPEGLISGHQVTSLDIVGEDDVISVLVLAFKARRLNITVNLT